MLVQRVHFHFININRKSTILSEKLLLRYEEVNFKILTPRPRPPPPPPPKKDHMTQNILSAKEHFMVGFILGSTSLLAPPTLAVLIMLTWSLGENDVGMNIEFKLTDHLLCHTDLLAFAIEENHRVKWLVSWKVSPCCAIVDFIDCEV